MSDIDESYEVIVDYKPPQWHTIRRKPASRRSIVNEFQAKLFVKTANQLIARLSRSLELQQTTLDQIKEQPEYALFIDVAYACGFVCHDMKPDADLNAVSAQPERFISSWNFPEIRMYIHTLLRAERWADGYSSPICEAISSGALAMVAERIGRDSELYSPVE